MPGIDESFQLQAAVRWAEGRGFTSLWGGPVGDLGKDEGVLLTVWPPVVPLAAGLLLKAGLGAGAVTTLMLLLKTAAAWGGTFAWLRLAGRVLPAAGVWVFALGLMGLLAGNSPWNDGRAGFCGPSHLMLWAVLPAGFLAAMDAAGRPAGPCLRAAVLCGLAGAAAVSVRWTGVMVPAATGAWVVLASAGSWGRRLSAGVLCGLPAGLVLAGVMAFNASQSDGAARPWILAANDGTVHPGNLLTREPATFLFAQGFGLEETVYKLKPSARHDWPAWVFAPWYALLAAVAVVAWRVAPAEWRAAVRPLAALTLGAGAVLLAVIGWAALHAGPEFWFNPAAELRYYGELLPAVAILWLAALSAAGHAVPRGRPAWWLAAGVAAAVVGLEVRFAFVAAKGAVRRTAEGLRQGTAGPELDAWLQMFVADHAPFERRGESAPGRGRHCVIDSFLGSVRRLQWRGDLLVRTPGFAPDPSAAGCSARTLVVVVVRWDRKRDGTLVADDETRRAWAWVRHLGISHRPWTVIRDGDRICALHARLVPAFAPGTRPSSEDDPDHDGNTPAEPVPPSQRSLVP